MKGQRAVKALDKVSAPASPAPRPRRPPGAATPHSRRGFGQRGDDGPYASVFALIDWVTSALGERGFAFAECRHDPNLLNG
ncbi:hypothetical protein [Rhodococcus sp. NCIMB 12038]|uniref:hypothetical protein n=1 Tax=Rhodococcus sp. NCIMB 12038 TaxID=933800 RepID=UPI000B3C316F|nr:hypothetical protein [Rhodococcus sp. NCIMB 12038]OUS85154.1 hypothetical protein CA951_39480 [Rhodococcus sp. NCIMB 12038]